MTVRLAIVGSTEPTNPSSAYLLVEMAIHWFKPELVVSGGAPGIDTIAIEVAKARGVPYREFLPVHRRWEPHGFKARNIDIASACTHLVRIANRDSKTYGSGWTADYAKKLGKEVFPYYL